MGSPEPEVDPEAPVLSEHERTLTLLESGGIPSLPRPAPLPPWLEVEAPPLPRDVVLYVVTQAPAPGSWSGSPIGVPLPPRVRGAVTWQSKHRARIELGPGAYGLRFGRGQRLELHEPAEDWLGSVRVLAAEGDSIWVQRGRPAAPGRASR